MEFQPESTRPPRKKWRILIAAVVLSLLSEAGVEGLFAQTDIEFPAHAGRVNTVEEFPPFNIIANIYFVGDADHAVYLITTPEGHILLDSGFHETASLVMAGVNELGFEVEDIEIMISGHAHIDHVGGHAILKHMTGARVLATEADTRVIESGGREGDYRGPHPSPWIGAEVDQIIHDGEEVRLGGTTMVANLTPGHTLGQTTWTMVVEDGGRALNVVFMPSLGRLGGVRLFDYPNYPNIVEDYNQTFRFVKAVPCDVFLGPHGRFYGLAEKYERMQAGAEENPFIDPLGCREYAERGEQGYLRQLEEERQARRP